MIVDETVFNVVQLVDVVYHFLAAKGQMLIMTIQASDASAQIRGRIQK
jgi:hypothetical protein